MKNILVSAFLLVAAFGAGYQFASYGHEAELLALEVTTVKAGDEAQEKVDKIEEDYKKKLDAINSREPVTVTVTERVYVNTTESCPVPTSDSTSVDDGRTTARVELAPENVKLLEQLAYDAEQQYKNCKVRLEAWQQFARELEIKTHL